MGSRSCPRCRRTAGSWPWSVGLAGAARPRCSSGILPPARRRWLAVPVVLTVTRPTVRRCSHGFGRRAVGGLRVQGDQPHSGRRRRRQRRVRPRSGDRCHDPGEPGERARWRQGRPRLPVWVDLVRRSFRGVRIGGAQPCTGRSRPQRRRLRARPGVRYDDARQPSQRPGRGKGQPVRAGAVNLRRRAVGRVYV